MQAIIILNSYQLTRVRTERPGARRQLEGSVYAEQQLEPDRRLHAEPRGTDVGYLPRRGCGLGVTGALRS